MELKWMAAFVAVAEELNFRRAAARLFIAQPAVSQQIMHLEKELEVRLFERTKRSVRLTDAGAAYLEPCRQILAGVDSAGRLARNTGSGEYGTIRIGFNLGFTTDQMVTLVNALRRDHPNLVLVFDTTRTTGEILRRLRDDQLDIALVGGPVTGAGLRRRRIGSTPLGVLLPDAHPLNAQDGIAAAELAGESLILVETPSTGWSIRRLVLDTFERRGTSPAAVINVADGMTMLSFVAAGIGVGFASLNTQALIPRGLNLRPIGDVPQTPTSAVWMPANETPALRTVIATIEQNLIDGPA